MTLVDLIIPLYNEEELVEVFFHQLSGAIDELPYHFRITYVNDGSTDQTQARIEAIEAKDSRVRIVELSRNFGHQAALTAGLDLATGDYAITLDGDGEHPPELIGEFLSLAEQGFEIVLAQREEAQQTGRFKRWTSELFYTVINSIGSTKIQPGAADFRLISRDVLESLKEMREYHRFLRGMIPWMGYRTAIIPYTPKPRIAGQSKYSLKKMTRLAVNAIFSFSLVPLYISLSLGGLFLILAMLEAVYVLSFWFTGRQDSLAPGWSSLMFMLLVIGGMVMITLGMIGIYLGFIFQEVKRRPIYLARRRRIPKHSSIEEEYSDRDGPNTPFEN